MSISNDKQYGESASDRVHRVQLTKGVEQYHESLKEAEIRKSKSNNPEDYDCSMGLSNILKSITLLSKVKTDNRKVFDIVIINALTMVRNCYDKNKSESQILKDISNDINTLLRYIQTYFLDQRDNVEKPAIIVYLPTYKLPERFMRMNDSPKDIKVDRLAKEAFGKKCTAVPTSIELSAGTLYLLTAGQGCLPYKTLSKLILTKCNAGVVKLMTRRYLLVSHCPLDLHLQNDLSEKLFLLESFTGNLKSIYDFGKKVFKEDHIPFNQYTHLLLGDNIHLKPQVFRNEKKKVIELAKKNMWDKKPTAIVLSDIRKLNVIPTDLLTSIKF